MRDFELLGKTVVIQGFEETKIENINELLAEMRKEKADCEIQFFDASMIAGFDHLYFATLNAMKAFEDGLNISKSLSVEILLFASGQHQIRKAVELLGVKKDSAQIILLIIARTRIAAKKVLNDVSKSIVGFASDEVIDLTDEKKEKIRKAFGITNLEFEAASRDSEEKSLTNLLVERTALLVTQR